MTHGLRPSAGPGTHDFATSFRAPEAGPLASVVIAMHDEGGNVGAVITELCAAFGGAAFEVVIVDDGSADDTFARARAMRDRHPEVRVLRHARRAGKTAALFTGVRAARGAVIVTMDGDGQNDPEDARRLLGALSLRPDGLAAGVRTERLDQASRRVATRLANGLRQAVLRDGCPDTGCGLKAFARDAFLELPCFEGMHRFLPALFAAYGRPVMCVPVGHRARVAGRSKYTNWGRALVGVVDLFGVLWLRARTNPPGSVTEA